MLKLKKLSDIQNENGNKKLKRKDRLRRIKENLNQISDHNSNIAKAKIKYENYIEEEKKHQLALHADNVSLYKSKKVQKNLIKKGSKYSYPQEELDEIRKISNRVQFDAKSITQEEILKFQELDLFISDNEQIQAQYDERNILNKLLLDDETGGKNNGA